MNYILEDWSVVNKTGKVMLYPFWFVRSCLVWLICPVFIPEYKIKQSNVYKEARKFMDSPEYQAQLAKTLSFMKFQ
jgi:hypothetical protein